jgi:hypothetical protein
MATNFDPLAAPTAPQYYKPTIGVGDILYRAYRMARALLNPGAGISNSESQEGLGILNSMIDGLKIEGLLMYCTRRSEWQVVIGQSIYSIGPGGDFDMERPEHIHRASYLVPSNPQNRPAEIPMAIVLTFEEWQQLTVKNTQSSFPYAMYYQPFPPLGAVNFYPVPNQVSTIVLYTPQTMSELSTVDDPIIVPDGFREMLQYNLAVAIHEVYPEKPMAPSVEMRADWYKRRVKANQLTPLFIGSDGGAIQNIYNSQFIGGKPQTWTPY